MNFRYLLFVICAVLILAGCNLNNGGDSDIIIDVDDDFKISFVEDLSTQADDLIIRLETIRNKECESDTVTIDMENFGTALRMNIDVINTVSNCISSSEPVFTQASTGMIENELVPITIRLEELISNAGDILKNEAGYEIKMETTHGFYLPYNQLKRVPKAVVWGYAGYPGNNQLVSLEFLNDLRNLTSDFELEKGNYGYFELSDDQGFVVEEERSEEVNTQAFIRAFSISDRRLIKALINEYREVYPNLRIFMRDSNGNILSDN